MSSASTDVYAVIRSGGKQYRVSPGQRVTLERLDGDAGDAIAFREVLLVNGGGEIAVGAPTVDAAGVTGEIVEQGRGKKVRVFKYKNKTRYRRLRGHRQLQTIVLVNEVSLGDQTWTAAVETSPVDEADEAQDEPTVDEVAAEAEIEEVETSEPDTAERADSEQSED